MSGDTVMAHRGMIKTVMWFKPEQLRALDEEVLRRKAQQAAHPDAWRDPHSGYKMFLNRVQIIRELVDEHIPKPILK